MADEKQRQSMDEVSVALVEDMHFVGDVGGFEVHLDAAEEFGGKNAGAGPLSFILLSVAGCTAMDVIAILRKKRQEITGLAVEVRGEQDDRHPKIYKRMEIVYRVRGKNVDSKAVERAIELSETQYCPAIATVAEVSEITSRYEIEEED